MHQCFDSQPSHDDPAWSKMHNMHDSFGGGSGSPQPSGSWQPPSPWMSMMDHLEPPKPAPFMPSQPDKSYVDQRTKDYIEQTTERFQDSLGVQSDNPYYGRDISKMIPESILKRVQYNDDEFDESLRGVVGKPYYNPKFDRRYRNPERESSEEPDLQSGGHGQERTVPTFVGGSHQLGGQFPGASGEPHYQRVESPGSLNLDFVRRAEMSTPSHGAASQFGTPFLGVFRQPNHFGFERRHCDQGTNTRGMNGTGIKIGQQAPKGFTPRHKDAGQVPGSFQGIPENAYFKGLFDRHNNQRSKKNPGFGRSIPETPASLIDHFCVPPPSATKLTYNMILDNSDSFDKPEEDLIAETRRTKLYGRDLGTLRGGGDGWLTDSVIDLYLEMIQWKFRFVHAFPSSFFAMLMSADGLNSVREAASETNIFNFELLFIPVCQDNHWRLLVVHVPGKTIIAFNSLPGSTDEENMDMLETWLNGEAGRRAELEYECSWRKRQERVPAQDNYHDCGVFLLQFARYICKGWEFNFSAENMQYFRERIMHECVKMKLLPD